MNQRKGFFALFTTAAILGTFGVLIRELSKSFTNNGQVFARSIFATLIISVILIFYKRINPLKIKRKDVKLIFLFSLSFPFSIVLFTVSVNLIKVSNSLFMLYVGSLVSTALYSRFMFKERFTRRHITSLILVFVGLSFFVYPFSFSALSLGIVTGLAAGVLEGTSHTLRKLMKDVKREVIVFYQSLSGVILASILLFSSGDRMATQFHPSSIIVAFVFGALLVTIGYLLVYGFSNFDVNLGAVILATELFFALVINAIVLKEYPTTFEIIGGLFIFAGTILTSLNLGNKENSTTPKVQNST